jgi:phenylacetic acid degradation protein
MTKVYAIDGLVPVVDPTAFVHPTASLIGDVIIGAGVYVGPGASLRGDFGRIEVRAGANVQDNCVMHCFPQADCLVEEDGHVGHGAILHGCMVKRGALVGMNAVVMDGAVIGEEAIVAAMAFVRAGFEVPVRSLAAGVPAKVLRELSAQEIAWKASGTREYQELARRCRATLHEATALTAPEPDRRRFALSDTAPLHMTRKR